MRKAKRKRGMARHFLLRAWPVLAALCIPGVLLGQDESTSEYQVKAAFLFHFAQFVDWPPAAFKDPASPMTYCIVGADPFQGGLDKTLSGKTIGARPVRVLHLGEPRGSENCQVMFIASTAKKLPAILSAVKDEPVLTVGDSEDFVRAGGMIAFCVEEKKIRFEINLDAAKQAKLRMSAKLLALAKTIIGDPRGT